MPDVATEALQMSDMHLSEGKCALSTLIFQKFSGAMPPDPHTGEGLRRPSPDLTPSALRSGPSVPPSSCPPLIKILAMRLAPTDQSTKEKQHSQMVYTTHFALQSWSVYKRHHNKCDNNDGTVTITARAASSSDDYRMVPSGSRLSDQATWFEMRVCLKAAITYTYHCRFNYY